MPGRNYCIPNCTVSETLKHKGVKLFQISTRDNDFYTKWRKETLDIISKFRVFDAVFKARIKNGRAFVCEKHYEESDFELTGKLFFALFYCLMIQLYNILCFCLFFYCLV